MQIKMICSVITNDLMNLTHSGVYTVSEELGKELISANYAIEVEKPKKTRKRATKKEEVEAQ